MFGLKITGLLRFVCLLAVDVAGSGIVGSFLQQVGFVLLRLAAGSPGSLVADWR
jgi:hypothetical protein